MDVEGRVSGMTPFHNINCPLVLNFFHPVHTRPDDILSARVVFQCGKVGAHDLSTWLTGFHHCLHG